MVPFSFQEGRKVFNGAIVCNFSFLFSPMRTMECKKKNREKLERRPQGDAEHDEATKSHF
jgi:hypothetical protein